MTRTEMYCKNIFCSQRHGLFIYRLQYNHRELDVEKKSHKICKTCPKTALFKMVKTFSAEGAQSVICPVIHNHFCSCIQKFNSVPTCTDVLFIKVDANEKVHLCVLLILIHQTEGRDVLAGASVSRLIMSQCLLFVFLSTAAKHTLTLGITAKQDISCWTVNIRDSFPGWVLTLVHDALTKHTADRDHTVTLHES